MQMKATRRSNLDRSRSTRSALIGAGRELFTAHPYGEIGTPQIVERAGVTRGALYHHYADKQALFAAVVEVEAAAVATEIEAAAPADMATSTALLAGGKAYLDAMAVPGRTRILLLDAPAILGYAHAKAIESRHVVRTLREGLEAAMASGALAPLPLEPLTQTISGAFDRAALAIEAGEDRDAWEAVLDHLLRGILRQPSRATPET